MGDQRKPRKTPRRPGVKRSTPAGRQDMSTQIIQTPSGEQKFNELLEAIKSNDRGALVSLREYWEDICEYVRSMPKTKVRKVQKILDEKEPVLSLWLSTPPPPKQADEDNSTLPDAVREDLEHRISLVNRLWDSWLNKNSRGGPRILDDLEVVFREYGFRHSQEWRSTSLNWFQRFPWGLRGEDVVDTQLRLDIVAGFGAFMDRLLIDQKKSQKEALVYVMGYVNPPYLALPNAQQIPLETIGRAIEFQSGVGNASAQELAGAILLSLPAHRDILYVVSVGLNWYQCSLESNRQSPFA